jgi:hypothetical protein
VNAVPCKQTHGLADGPTSPRRAARGRVCTAYCIEQGLCAERLRQVAVKPCRLAPPTIHLIGISGERYQPAARECRFGTQERGKFVTIHVRQTNVEQYDLWMKASGNGEREHGAVGDARLMAAFPKQLSRDVG